MRRLARDVTRFGRLLLFMKYTHYADRCRARRAKGATKQSTGARAIAPTVIKHRINCRNPRPHTALQVALRRRRR
jgi:hypothetical protein